MKSYAVLGDPVSHSLSPALQGAWIAAAGLDATYSSIQIPLEAADGAFADLSVYGLNGANVTVPHKERAAKAADVLDETARVLGAANVLSWTGRGLEGFNTDGAGVIGALDEGAPDWRTHAETALVIGAGGAAKAAALALSRAGTKRILIVNRTRASAEGLAGLVPCAEVLAWGEMDAAFAAADVIVQATSLGLKGAGSPDWPMALAKPRAIVMDAVYAPLETPFLAAARARGLVALDGLGMLLHQGAGSFRIWFGVSPDAEVGRAALVKALAAREAALG